MSTFKTVQEPSSAEFKDRGSRFIAYTFFISGKSDVERYLAELRAQHPKSRHLCFAYVLGSESNYRVNDDGEPSGSAGLPIFNQIRSAGLLYTMVAVIRYFGGTKLGVPGLINAYKTAARDALSESGVKDEVEKVQMQIFFTYHQMETVMSYVKSRSYDVLDQKFDDNCTLTIKSPSDEFEECKTYFEQRSINCSVSDIDPLDF